MQWRKPVGAGPSSKTWPRCASQRAQSTSVRTSGRVLSSSSRTLRFETGAQKLGQPVCESYFAFELKSATSQQTHRYMPRAYCLLRGLVYGAYVPLRRATSNCSGVSRRRHSSSVLTTRPTPRPRPSAPKALVTTAPDVHANASPPTPNLMKLRLSIVLILLPRQHERSFKLPPRLKRDGASAPQTLTPLLRTLQESCADVNSASAPCPRRV